ncbi:MAG: hypothetical protein DBX59_08985 [Bacillota bacterium]|nr:MAG: hypothetical protein DBX59_08985 [Bacillota bacterium]
MLTLFYDCYCVLNKVYSEKAYLKQALADTPVEEKNRPIIVKTCYGVLDNDAALGYYISVLSPKNPKAAVRTVLKIAMYHIKYLKKHPYAVIDNAVELVKKLGKGGVSGYVNALLRRFSEKEIPLPQDNIKRLCVRYSFPEFAVRRLIGEYGESRAESILSAQGGDTTLVFYEGDGEEYLSSRRAEFKKTPFENTFTVKNFLRNEDYDRGIYTYQSVGSAAICAAVEGGEKLLDACAAPGGKSVNLSRRFQKIVACELHEHRAKLIESYARRMGVDNVEVVVSDSSKRTERFVGAFDAVLCDVPCSGFGVAFENPDIKLNKEERNLAELVALQRSILQNCAAYVKNGGFLYYSTCSFFGEENSENVEDFLKRNEDFELCALSSPLAHEKKSCGLQFLPDSSGGGFFIAKLKKKG